MDEATKKERLGLLIQHANARQQIAALRTQQEAWSKRMAEIDRAETIATLHPNVALNQGGDPLKALGITPQVTLGK